MDSIFDYMEKYDFENLFFCQDRALNFKAVIAIHDTTLGPATGGCRMWNGYAGDIAPMTAYGTIRAMQACCNRVYGSDSLEGKHIVVQGLGAVGHNVVEQLHELGARLTVTDIDPAKVETMTARFKVKAVHAEAVYDLDCDIFCPCALGKVINDDTLGRLKCKIICGSANNQLAEERHGDRLEKEGLVYAPDYIANAGGTIYDTDRLGVGGVSHKRGKTKVARVYDNMQRVFEIADRDRLPTYQAADRMAEERIRQIAEVKKYVNDL
jgi:leucine dehydrogenase